MDAREALRRYLEQRRDQGERELVLDSLSVEEALHLLGATASSPVAGTNAADWRTAVRAAGGAPAAVERVHPAAPAGDKQEGHAPLLPSRTSAAQGASAPELDVAAAAAHVPDTHAAAGVASPLDGVPAGIIVGGASRAIADHPAFQLTTLEEIADMVAGCRRCALSATATNPVPGDGNPTADFMIVGEAPGAHEDQQGKPFVGPAGQLLTKILAAIDLKRDDVFITNVLKHRPPGNRNPLAEEVTACSPYLVRQIELIRPKVILALGTFAAQTLLETKLTIGKLRGQVHRYYGVPLIVTYHPAALLRNPAWKRPTWEDVQLARRILDRAVAPGA